MEEARLTPNQIETLDKILRLGGERPNYSIESISEIKSILKKTDEYIEKNVKNNLYFAKSDLSNIANCEGLVIAKKEEKVESSVNIYTIIGSISHKAIMMSYTHPNKNVTHYVKESIISLRSQDDKINNFFATCGDARQSEIIGTSISRVTNFLDDWPKLDPSWNPRFEEGIMAKFGKLSFGGRVDLILGRPRTDMKRSLLIVDFKSSGIKENHRNEALYYALACTIRHNLIPWRSIVYSLSSGEFTDLDFSEEELVKFTYNFADKIEKFVNLIYKEKDAVLSFGDHCNYCYKKDNCIEFKKNSDPKVAI